MSSSDNNCDQNSQPSQCDATQDNKEHTLTDISDEHALTSFLTFFAKVKKITDLKPRQQRPTSISNAFVLDIYSVAKSFAAGS